MRSSRFAVLALSAAALLAGPARAQVPAYNPYVNPYYNPYQYGNRGGALTGAANLVNAQGEYMMQTEQARMAQQQVEQMKQDTRRKTLDETNYEKANMQTTAEAFELQASATVRRMLADASTTEITSGVTLNTLDDFVRRLTDQGVVGPMIPLDPGMVKMLDLAPAGGTVTNPGLGVCANWDNAPWPLSLYDARKEIDPLVRKVIYEVRMRELNPKTFDAARKKVRSTNENLYKLLTPGKVDTGAYVEATTFLNNLDNSLATLRQPDAYKYFTSDYVAKGSNVLELAMYVTGNGLRFTPARLGHESAYVATHRATVSYIRAAQGTSAFTTRIGDPKQFGKFGGNN